MQTIKTTQTMRTVIIKLQATEISIKMQTNQTRKDTVDGYQYSMSNEPMSNDH